MRRLLLLPLLLGVSLSTNKVKAREINCNSPVFRGTEECIDNEPEKSQIRASEDDLGGADFLGPDSEIEEKGYKAFCGQKAKPCNVAFIDGRLSINKGKGITNSQLIGVTKDRTCREVFMGLPNCYSDQFDHDYTFRYRDKKGNERAALIILRPGTFLGRGKVQHQAFKRDLQVWMKDVLRPIGPSIEIE
tara:strand:- start:134 stop:703 length:570 start_codon:yes stop_codon:yes gene_type:complete